MRLARLFCATAPPVPLARSLALAAQTDEGETEAPVTASYLPAGMASRLRPEIGSRARSTLWILGVWLVVGPTVVAQEVTVRRDSDWPMFRGNPQLTGVAAGPLRQPLTLRWRFEVGDAVTSSAAIVRGGVYVGCDDGFLYAIDLAPGKLHWKYEAKAMLRSSPTVVDGTVFIGDDEGVLHAVDVKTGRRRWVFQTDDQIISSANCDGGRVVFGSYDGFVYCLSADHGKLIWKFETEGRVHGTPGLASGFVVAAGCDKYLHVLRLADGSPIRKVSMGSVSGASAAIRGSHVYVGTYAGRVLDIDWSAGKTTWVFQDPDRQLPYLSSAAVMDRVVILGSRDKRLRCLDRATGRLRWAFPCKGRIDASPVIAGNRVYAPSMGGNLYAVDLSSGREVWRFEAGAPISASPAIGNRCLVLGTEDGVIYCFSSD